MKRIYLKILLPVLILSIWILPAWAASRVEIPSSPLLHPVGSGARALGMGGAFIAVADDATAASWNPGGLIQLDSPEMSVVYGCVHRAQDNSFAEHPEAEGTAAFDYFDLNYLSIAYPFELLKRNMILSLNYQQMYVNYSWSYKLDERDPSFFTDFTRSSYEQDGALYALGLAYCIQLNISFSLGITLNYWGDVLFESQWEQKYSKKWETKNGTDSENRTEEYSFKGWNANLGFLWRLSEQWTVGGVFKTPFTADIEHTVTGETIATNQVTPIDERYDEKLHMPMSYGIGIAYRHSDWLTVSADVYRTHWEDFELENEAGVKFSPITAKEIKESDIDPTTWFRMGAEYLYIGEKFVIPFRGGIFYDPAPSEGSADAYYGISLGTGFLYEPRDRKKGLWERLIFDVAYQFRFGEDVGTHMLKDLNFSQDIQEHTVYASVIVHF